MSNKEVADRFRQIADNIEIGEYGEILSVIHLMSTDKGSLRLTCGGPNLTNRYIAGTLSFALFDLMHAPYENE